MFDKLKKLIPVLNKIHKTLYLNIECFDTDTGYVIRLVYSNHLISQFDIKCLSDIDAFLNKEKSTLKWQIKSIKRVSDNAIFTIRDIIKGKSGVVNFDTS